MQIQNENVIDEGLVEVKNHHFKQLIPWYSHEWHYYDHYYDVKNGFYEYGETIFDYAHNNKCSCATGWVDSTIGSQDFKMKLTIESSLTDQSGLCNDDMEDAECYYQIRQHDPFDLSIENVAKDACVVCYGVGPQLWPIPEDQLMNAITRSEGDKLIHYDDCSPKSGYHKSRRNEVYRCEGGDDEVGVMAFTESNGNTDYDCGFDGSWITAFNIVQNHKNWYPVFSVSFSYLNSTLFNKLFKGRFKIKKYFNRSSIRR